MYKKKSPQINMFETPETFMLMAEMDPDNRWVKMAKLIPWDMVVCLSIKKVSECASRKSAPC